MTTARAIEPRRVAVLGGTGFLGRSLCEAFDAHGHNVIAVARRTPSDFRFPVRVLDLAYATPQEVTRFLAADRVDVVVNAAGGMWGLSDAEMVAANVTLVESLIEGAAALSAPLRVVQLGSVHEYGLVPVGESMHESLPASPVMKYGELKAQCTEAITAATAAGRIDGLTLRIGNVVGAGQPSTSLLGVVAKQLVEAGRSGERANLQLGSLQSRRDFIGLDESVDAVVAATTRPLGDAHVVNIGSGVALSARQMVDLLVEVSRVPTDLTEAPAQPGPESDMWQQLDVTLAARLLGWHPKRDLRDDMQKLWDRCSAAIIS